MKFVIDEDLPRSTARILREKGFEVYDIRDHGLRGQEDGAIVAPGQPGQRGIDDAVGLPGGRAGLQQVGPGLESPVEAALGAEDGHVHERPGGVAPGCELRGQRREISRERRLPTIDAVRPRRIATDSRSRETVEASIPGSWVFGVYDGSAQVAFARVVTDRATFAWICDVIVDEAYRGRGIGTWLMQTLTAALDDVGVKRQLLATLDAHEVYRPLGYVELAHPERWMERDLRPDVPPRPQG